MSYSQAMRLRVSEPLAATCRLGAENAAWLERLPELVAAVQRRWSLTLRAPFYDSQGACAWVCRVTCADGSHAVLKVGLPHMEAEHEIAGLRCWDGENTVRLLEADEEMSAMLLEACVPGTPLSSLPEPEQDAVMGKLLPRLWLDPPTDAQFRPVSAMLELWSSQTRRNAANWVEPALIRLGLELFGELTRTTLRRKVLFTDLHAGNVLRAERRPWLAIDPKPFVGDPCYDGTQHLLNCQDRMLARPEQTIADFAALLDLDASRLRLWMFARAAAQPRQRWQGDPWLDVARSIAP